MNLSRNINRSTIGAISIYLLKRRQNPKWFAAHLVTYNTRTIMPDAGSKCMDLSYPTVSARCNYLSLYLKPASGTHILNCFHQKDDCCVMDANITVRLVIAISSSIFMWLHSQLHLQNRKLACYSLLLKLCRQWQPCITNLAFVSPFSCSTDDELDAMRVIWFWYQPIDQIYLLNSQIVAPPCRKSKSCRHLSVAVDLIRFAYYLRY